MSGLEELPVVVSSPKELAKALKRDRGVFTHIILDQSLMTDIVVREILRIRRQKQKPPPSIILTGQALGPAAAVNDDFYLAKPLHRNKLRALLRGAILGQPKVENALPLELRKNPARILVAEDNAINARLATLLLQRLGHRVDWAENGEEALALFYKGGYSAVLMDCQMPIIDGYEATRRIRIHEAGNSWPHPRALIIATTANAFPEERNNCLLAGMDVYLSKPYLPEDLQRVLATMPDFEPTVGGERTLDDEPLARLHRDIGPEAMLPLLEIWLEDIPAKLETLLATIERSDAGGIKKAAHGLRGSCSVFGLRRLAKLLSAIELESHRENPDYNVLTFEIKSEMSRANSLIEQKRLELKTGKSKNYQQ